MKKSQAIAAAMASIALTGTLGGCFDPAKNEVVDVYGPPPAREEEDETENENGYAAGDGLNETEETEKTEEPSFGEAASDFRPEENTVEAVYGPPPTAGSVE